MQVTCARAALAALMAVLATLSGCGRVDTARTPQAALARPATAQRAAADALPGGPAPAAPAAAGVQEKQAAVDGNVHSLGAAGGTSVLDPDVLISERVKAALASSPEVAPTAQVDVSSRDGAVTLRGRVPDPQARERATEIARSIPNVKDVDNQLTLG
jgi:hyperosmotically inducible periplasmic protein